MKWKIALFALILILIGAIFFVSKNPQKEAGKQNFKLQTTTVPSNVQVKQQSKSIFVPHWASYKTLEINDYDRVIYFGITPTKSGINKEEAGYEGLPTFIKATEGKEKLLTVRMTDDDTNFFVLENEDLQKKIIDQTLDIVNNNLFSGVVLDLEIHDPFNTDITGQINEFVQQFYSEAHKHYRKFSMTIYGDTFFRRRPYDLPFLAKNSDEIMIMAYDFHKSRGEPGPNFPLSGQDIYGYDFQQMTNDFLKFVPNEKLTIVFGMFGYDWLVDEKKRPIRPAKALSLNEIQNKFLENGCNEESCVIRRDDQSTETEINYVISTKTPDDQGVYRIDYHIVWFEDQESMKIKSDYLQKNGIANIAFWAHGYF